MKRKRFLHLLDLEGSDVSRWPTEDRAAALALMARSPDARRAHARAVAEDLALAPARRSAVSSDSVARVMAAVARIPEQAARSMPVEPDEPTWRWRPSLVWLAASAVFGVVVGAYLERPAPSAADIGSLLTATLSSGIFGS